MSTILIVDDEEMIRLAFAAFLADEGHEALLAASGGEAARLLAANPESLEIAFIDYRLPDRDGLAVLENIKTASPETAAVIMTAHGRMDVAIRAMQTGAYEYLTKPLDLDQIRQLINRIIGSRTHSRRLAEQGTTAAPTAPADRMIGSSPAMQEIFKLIGILSMHDVTVLITGESGSGKELVAQAIHDHSLRKCEPFVAVNCGAVPEQLLESELFGHERGAFTGADRQKPGKFELAGRGTIFLDEIGELQPSLQVKLLRVLQEQAFFRVGGTAPVPGRARVIAATNRDLLADMRAGLFRKDLYYRLHLVHLLLPPLRERQEDIPLLIDHFLHKINGELGTSIVGIEEDAARRLLRHRWPGNVRELENTLRRAMVLTRDRILTTDLFELAAQPAPGVDEGEEHLCQAITRFLAAAGDGDKNIPLEKIVGMVEKTAIIEAMRRTGGNQVQMARMLGLHRSTLRTRMQTHHLPSKPE